MADAREHAWAQDRLRRLQRVSLDLTAALSLDEVAAAVIDALDAPIDAPSRGLWLREAGSQFLELFAQHGVPPDSAEQFRRIPLSADLPGATAVRERRTIVSTGHDDAVARFSRLHDVSRSTSGFLAVPLLADQEAVGVLAIGVNDVLDDDDIGFFEAVAAQVAQTIVRVRLTERERRRRTELEFLAGLTEKALSAVDHIDLMQQVCRAAVPTLGDWCSVYYLPETADRPLVASAHVDPAVARFAEQVQRRHPYDASRSRGVPAVIRTGRTEFVPELTDQIVDEAVEAAQIEMDEAQSILEAFQITSAITVALRTKRRVVGAMQFVSGASGRHYDEADVALAEAVAGRLAEALEAAWLTDQQRAVAVALQQALLPPALPAIPGIDLAARYWPAGISGVGGDFYDVFQLDDRRWALLIGDVCGTGPNAAALTSIARHTVRAAARHHGEAGEVIAWLNEAVCEADRDRFLTAVYATLTALDDGWQLQSTAAGHPLPIVSTATGTAPLGRPGSLLGVLDVVSTTDESIRLDSGDVIVFYTDGITDLPPPYGIGTDELVDLVQKLRSSATGNEIADAIHRSLLDRVPDRSRQDDVALLVLRVD